MKQKLPWLVAAVAIFAAIVTFNELQRMRGRFAEATRPLEFHEHAEVRRFIIKAQLASVSRPIIVFGDSLVEEAILPRTICGIPVINAGVGGATSYQSTRFVSDIVENNRPALVVLAFGTNDVLYGNTDFKSDYTKLLEGAGSRPILLSISPIAGHDVHEFNEIIRAASNKPNALFVSLGEIDKAEDGIHLSPTGMHQWSERTEKAIKSACENSRTTQ